ncbi:hypothetical protein [Microbulbifer rhizosphaerae]|uniref:ApeA N-terminal domain-containing protein n=1 Tax=Microbulbifer rhizosphaerae TaxID=1562603 RepID=A0A7W4WC02_9GAMM|nr:hypothetical protein [Microbulbifer rhizosphaerae]MBB3061415.1 hypothetical protein [Microbulbifer rhizosphaerae]
MSESKNFDVAFHGKMPAPNGEILDCLATISFPRWDSTKLSVELLWLGGAVEQRNAGVALRGLKENFLKLTCVSSEDVDVELLGIVGIGDSRCSNSAQVSSISLFAVQFGIAECKFEKEREITVIVRLQPSGILGGPSIRTVSFDGAVEIKKTEPLTIGLDFEGGMLEAMETFEYYETTENGNEVTHQVRRSSITGNIKIASGDSLYDVNERLKKYLDEVCDALSLSYRQKVDYYEIEYIGADQEGQSFSSRFFRRKLQAVEAKASTDELIHSRGLADRGLQHLVNEIGRSSRSEDVRRAIRFLAASFSSNVETAFFMTFSAMETIVSCCLNGNGEYVVEKSKWKKVESLLRTAIKGLDMDIPREQLMAKLPELKRSALNSRILRACEIYNPKTSDLWPDLTFEEGMRRAASIRNGLFHAASSGKGGVIFEDLVRVRTFTERLILKLLSWPDDDVWRWYDQDLKWLNGK